MDLFQILEVSNVVYNNSLSKVTVDICSVAEKYKFKTIRIVWNSSAKHRFAKFKKNLRYWWDWHKCYNEITDNSTVLLQHPLHVANSKVLKKLKSEKNVKYISVIIDIEELRKFYYNEFHKKEFELMLDIADVLIVHNNIMARYLIEKGIPEEKIINIETFDYLQNNDNVVKFEKSITFAGNLDRSQCSFIEELNQLEQLKINLYGSNFDKNLSKFSNIKYHGSFPVDEIPKKLNRGFGLVWNGDSIYTCSGNFGQYLKYNNPHKLSLYLSCGLPVIIWNQAAQAEFVKKYNVGICVENLKEAEQIINNMSESDYKALQMSVCKIKDLLCSGYFATKAINKALNLLQADSD